MLTFLRFSSIMALAFVTIIVAPAHWVNGSSFWTVASCTYLLHFQTCLLTLGAVWFAGAFPFIALNWALRPMVTEIFLRLPPSAQGSPKLAMAYASSLPADATLDLRFMRSFTITDVVLLKIANTRPMK